MHHQNLSMVIFKTTQHLENCFIVSLDGLIYMIWNFKVRTSKLITNQVTAKTNYDLGSKEDNEVLQQFGTSDSLKTNTTISKTVFSI